jgi:isoquinoline 1-oxidoreductase alpha subunit
MISFVLNGTPVESSQPGDTPLLWVIRDEFSHTGTKFGCGIGFCGVCTVHVDGRAVRSCIATLDMIRDAAVTTIEGLGADGQHPLQKAWIDVQAPQCGYCQPGQIMQAAALLVDYPDPSDAEIAKGMNGNLCRCMAYYRIRDAIKLAAAAMREEKKA